ncbi:MAG: hypothetical protein I8H91_02335 [Burkholderiales bacterium]|nr:hypothetical protein [Burkholderiales bacterium]
MPRGDKSGYTGKQKRQAEHIEEGYGKKGVPESTAHFKVLPTSRAHPVLATVAAATMETSTAARKARYSASRG